MNKISSSSSKSLQLSEMIPLEKLKKQLEIYKDNTKEKVVLVATGCYNPVHRMHLEIFEKAKKIFRRKS